MNEPCNPLEGCDLSRAVKVGTLYLAADVPEPLVRTIYTFAEGAEKTDVEFFAVPNVPGFTHVVFCNGKKTGWLAQGFRPSKATAKYYYAKHRIDA